MKAPDRFGRLLATGIVTWLGIQTLVNLQNLHTRSLDTAVKVAKWTIANMQDKSGYFYYRKYHLITNKTATIHWGQATMFAALALLAQCLEGWRNRPDAAPASQEHASNR